MRKRKRYEPHCPSSNCVGGRANRLHRIVDAAPLNIPPDLLEGKDPEDPLYYCSYCGLLWYQDTGPVGLRPTVVGYLDHASKPGFVPVNRRSFRIREDNLDY